MSGAKEHENLGFVFFVESCNFLNRLMEMYNPNVIDQDYINLRGSFINHIAQHKDYINYRLQNDYNSSGLQNKSDLYKHISTDNTHTNKPGHSLIPKGATLLQVACLSQDSETDELIKIILNFIPDSEKAAAINHQNSDGYSALMYVAKTGNKDIMQLLIDHGGDVEVENQNDPRENSFPSAIDYYCEGLVRDGIEEYLDINFAVNLISISSNVNQSITKILNTCMFPNQYNENNTINSMGYDFSSSYLADVYKLFRLIRQAYVRQDSESRLQLVWNKWNPSLNTLQNYFSSLIHNAKFHMSDLNRTSANRLEDIAKLLLAKASANPEIKGEGLYMYATFLAERYGFNDSNTINFISSNHFQAEIYNKFLVYMFSHPDCNENLKIKYLSHVHFSPEACDKLIAYYISNNQLDQVAFILNLKIQQIKDLGSFIQLIYDQDFNTKNFLKVLDAIKELAIGNNENLLYLYLSADTIKMLSETQVKTLNDDLLARNPDICQKIQGHLTNGPILECLFSYDSKVIQDFLTNKNLDKDLLCTIGLIPMMHPVYIVDNSQTFNNPVDLTTANAILHADKSSNPFTRQPIELIVPLSVYKQNRALEPAYINLQDKLISTLEELKSKLNATEDHPTKRLKKS